MIKKQEEHMKQRNTEEAGFL